MRGTRTILAAALLTGLPVAAHSQGMRAPADAFLYIIWPPDGATVKGAFWCRLGLRNMGVTQAGSSAPNSGHHHLLIDVDGPLDPNEPIPAGQDTSSFRRRAVCHNLHYRLSGKLTGGTTLLWGTECVMSSPR